VRDGCPLPTLTVAEPAVGSVLGIVVLGERLQTNDVGRFALALAVVAIVAATAALARGAAVATENQPARIPRGLSGRAC